MCDSEEDHILTLENMILLLLKDKAEYGILKSRWGL